MVSGVWQVMFNPDGRLWIERLAAVWKTATRQCLLPPVVTAPTFAIRKPAVAVFTLDDYVTNRIMTAGQAAILQQAVIAPCVAPWARQAPEVSFKKVAIVHQAFRVQNVCTEMSKPGEKRRIRGCQGAHPTAPPPLKGIQIVQKNQSHKFCIAPMMEWTDRHCRMFHRFLSANILLYTEMVTAQAVIRGNREKLLGYDQREHPVALQLGGSEPALLAEAAKIGEDFGYGEINLNVGCPSDRVQSGKFGACLMLEPELVAECVSAMAAQVKVPVTVKCRIGVDDQNPQIALRAMLAQCKAAGTRIFILHARKAILGGLSPKENREIPPLDYDLVYAVKCENPDLTIVINGGIASLDTAEACLNHVDGVMLGRAAYQSPGLLADVDSRFFGGEPKSVDRAMDEFLDYVESKRGEGVPLNAMTRHILGAFHGRPGARQFRRHLSENAPRFEAGAEVLREALSFVKQAAL